MRYFMSNRLVNFRSVEGNKMQKRRTIRFIGTSCAPLVISCALFVCGSAFDCARTSVPGIALAQADGNALYGSRCAICHGKGGVGTPAWKAKGQPDLSSSEWQKKTSDEQIESRIRDGKGKMPGFGKKLSEEEIKALVRQVRTFRR
jgi:mono/diheme cytochrome c family protein